MQNHPIYANVEFPDYEYREFPKAISKPLPEGGRRGIDDFVMVHNEDEERVALGGGSIVREDDVKAQLLEQAKQSGVLADKRWGPDRLRSELQAKDITPCT